MQLSARLLNDVSGVNSFLYADYLGITESDTVTVYLQLVDLSVETQLSPAGRRYMPVASSTLSVVMRSNDTGAMVTKTATQPFLQDPSIWSFSLTTTETLPGTDSLKLTLSEPTGAPGVFKLTHGWVEAAISIKPLAPEF